MSAIASIQRHIPIRAIPNPFAKPAEEKLSIVVRTVIQDQKRSRQAEIDRSKTLVGRFREMSMVSSDFLNAVSYVVMGITALKAVLFKSHVAKKALSALSYVAGALLIVIALGCFYETGKAIMKRNWGEAAYQFIMAVALLAGGIIFIINPAFWALTPVFALLTLSILKDTIPKIRASLKGIDPMSLLQKFADKTPKELKEALLSNPETDDKGKTIPSIVKLGPILEILQSTEGKEGIENAFQELSQIVEGLKDKAGIDGTLAILNILKSALENKSEATEFKELDNQKKLWNKILAFRTLQSFLSIIAAIMTFLAVPLFGLYHSVKPLATKTVQATKNFFMALACGIPTVIDSFYEFLRNGRFVVVQSKLAQDRPQIPSPGSRRG